MVVSLICKDTAHIRIFYPADPVGVVPGGVDTFIRGVIKFSPEDLVFSLVGISTDTRTRPTRRWTQCKIGCREFDFYPVIKVGDAGGRSRIPLSLRYAVGVAKDKLSLRRNFDLFEFHRIEPLLLFAWDPRPKNAFFHTNMESVRDSSTDMLWKHAPNVYEAIERFAISRLSSLWSVRTDAVAIMRARYPAKTDTINFIPTWVDTEVFSPLPEGSRLQARRELAAAQGLDPTAIWIVSVGRLDTSKDPGLLVSAVAKNVSEGKNVNLLLVGDGVLRSAIERLTQAAGIDRRVRLLGLRSPEEISRILASSDVFALSSAYEGMPMALLEALGCGLPVATTDVGEVRRVVQPGLNGSIAVDRSVEGFAASLDDVLVNRDRYRGEPAVRAIQRFRPAEVLQPVYENYRELASRYRAQSASSKA
jgi:glycosyltransferase involved in cell wall biosynthesis